MSGQEYRPAMTDEQWQRLNARRLGAPRAVVLCVVAWLAGATLWPFGAYLTGAL